MNERIKALAEQAGVSFHHALGATYTYGKLSEILERFADLVRDDLIAMYKQALTDPENQPSQYGTVTVRYMEQQITSEREVCAKLCEARGNLHDGLFGNWAQDIAKRIRARSKHD